MQTHKSRRPTANIRDATEQNKSTSSVRAALYTHLLGDCDSKIAAIVNDLNDSGTHYQTDMTVNVIKLKKFTKISSTLQQKTIGMYQNSVELLLLVMETVVLLWSMNCYFEYSL